MECTGTTIIFKQFIFDDFVFDLPTDLSSISLIQIFGDLIMK